MRAKYDRKQANLDFCIDIMLIGAKEHSRRNRTFSLRGLSTSHFTIVKYLHFLSIFPSYIHHFSAVSSLILHFLCLIHHNQIVSIFPSRGVVISLMPFCITNIPKTPVLSAFFVLYSSQSKNPDGN